MEKTQDPQVRQRRAQQQRREQEQQRQAENQERARRMPNDPAWFDDIV